MCDVAARADFGADAVHFVSENNAHREGRLPFEQVDGMRSGFDGGDLVVLLAKLVEQRQWIGRVFPADGFFGSQRGFANRRSAAGRR